MPDFNCRVASASDVPAIVHLANQYTYQHLSEQDRQAGFLTGVFSEEQVRRMIQSAPSIVAYNQTELAGFIINTKLPPPEYPPLVQEIIKALPQLKFKNLPVTQYTYFFYGPALVATPYRQQGLLQRMFLQTKKELQAHYNLGLAFIDGANQASYQVHTKHLDFKAIGEITFNNRAYAILAFNPSLT
ncbi:hypothetical protein HUW51_03880 [Adhaeribacter swui]|uniref:GNAT family N-acetyltransferase n=1 Tax=Adhaeribacter swui TaxID=2086471 RepID=A0A7G7G418_9BACT|nr:hypothetical protein [Adhaeribacter swui]QNF31902.1 hypothetical protein HUW51_03880 [Adhaeribacter swui]